MTPFDLAAPDFKNVSTDSKNARLTLDSLGVIYQLRLFLTVTKTSPTADAAFNPTLSDALGLMNLSINDIDGKRQITAQELNEIQTAWSANLAAVYYSGKDGNFNTVADTTETDNSVACTVRTGTWVLRMNFMEPSRDSYAARQFFGLPTLWVDKNGKKTTAKVQLVCVVPGASSVTNYVPLTAMATGKYNLKNHNYRCEQAFIKDQSGPFVGDTLVNGQWVAGGGVTPMMPLVHFQRLQLSYGSTTPTYRNDDLNFNGAVQQISFFSPSGSGDDVTAFEYKKNTVSKLKISKQSNDIWKLDNNWNLARLQSSTGDASGTNWPAADVFHLAFDADDNPFNAENKAAGDKFEIDLTLAQVTATNKNIVAIAQVYKDALVSAT